VGTVHSRRVGKRKDPSPCRESSPGRPARNLFSVLRELVQLSFFTVIWRYITSIEDAVSLNKRADTKLTTRCNVK